MAEAQEVAEQKKRNLVSPPMLYGKTQGIIAAIEEKLGEQLITYWNSPKGSICSNDVPGLYGLLRNVGKVDRLPFHQVGRRIWPGLAAHGSSVAAACKKADRAGAV